MKLLFLDLETAPNLGAFWQIRNQYISTNQLIETSRVMCFSAKWHGTRETIFDSEHKSGHREMVEHLHRLLSEADVVCHYNGNNFDIPVANREFFLYNMSPPDPYKNLDLYRIIKRRFRFVSNKLDHVVQELKLGKKVKHEGFELWLKCMDKNEDAWKRMERYNRQDVVLLSRLYLRTLPWIDTHPNRALYRESGTDMLCPNCSSTQLIKKGIEHLKTRSYQRYKCKACGIPVRESKALPNTSVTLTQSRN